MDILERVKAAIGITGNYQDKTISEYISEVKEYMIDSGVSETVVNSDVSAGTITRGVLDLWNYGGVKLSDYFIQRVTQLAYKKIDTTDSESEAQDEL